MGRACIVQSLEDVTVVANLPEGLRYLGIVPDRLRGCAFLLFEGAYLPGWEVGNEPWRYCGRAEMLADWEARKVFDATGHRHSPGQPYYGDGEQDYCPGCVGTCGCGHGKWQHDVLSPYVTGVVSCPCQWRGCECLEYARAGEAVT